jgi:acetyltransferase-like isoleucine patch superfamily enzyme
MNGCDNNLDINSSEQHNNTTIIINGNSCRVKIGTGTSINGAYILCMGKQNFIEIGEECMLADGINIWASDSHPIFNLDCPTQILNPSQPIRIGNHVWIGKNATILKGVTIGDNCVIGMGSVVTKDIPSNCVVVGNPSKIIKTCINWNRKHILE